MPPTPLEDIARSALDGDRDAVERLVKELQSGVYGVALRMLWNREDAEDATQEILVRVVTRLSQFDFRSKLKTWVYRVAVNYLIDVKKSPIERMHLNFQGFADDLLEGLSSEGPADAERSLLVEEVKIGCTLGMLQCLDRPHRLAYVLGEILDLSFARYLWEAAVPALGGLGVVWFVIVRVYRGRWRRAVDVPWGVSISAPIRSRGTVCCVRATSSRAIASPRPREPPRRLGLRTPGRCP